MTFEHRFVDDEGGHDGWGAAVAADFDGDGRAEFVTGGKGGGFYHLYDFEPDRDAWTRHVITDTFSPNVGAAAVDLDGDGRLELVCGEWGNRLLWLVRPVGGLDGWTVYPVAGGLEDPHDIVAGDVDGDGRTEVVVREKDGRALLYRAPEDPRQPWAMTVVAQDLAGDGTALADLSGNGALDIVTNAGWFENAAANGTVWVRQPLVDPGFEWHPESRLAVGDVDGDGVAEVVVTESEIGPARLAVLRRRDPGQVWDARVVLDVDLDLRALHSLQIVDLDNDGKVEIFTAEMENGKTDGVSSKPRWWGLSHDGEGWTPRVLLDTNLGTHCAIAADYAGDGTVGIVGKVWRANKVNGNGGRNHVDYLWRHHG